MKKRYFSTLLLASLVFVGANAQSKISAPARMFMMQNQEATLSAGTRISVMGTDGQSATPQVTKSRVGALVMLQEGHSFAELEAAGYEISSHTRTVGVVNIPLNKVEELAELEAVRQIDFGTPQQMHMNFARQNLGTDAVQQGTIAGIDHAYTGKGVVTGIYDTGVMANHINFYDDEHNQRIQRLYHYYYDADDNGWISSYNSPEAVMSFSTDTIAETHGTHTLGIMAGGYKGNLIYGYDYNSDADYTSDYGDKFMYFDGGPNPFYGNATESDILVGCGELSSGFAIDAFTKISQYAADNGQPCVINYSVGSVLGPHDGSDAFCQALKELSDEYGTIFCISSGNDGAKNTFLKCEGGKTTKTIVDRASNGYCLGYVDMWASDERPFKCEFIYYKKAMTSSGETVMATCSAVTSASVIANTTAMTSPNSSTGANAIIYLSEVNTANNRYHVQSLFNAVKPKGTSTIQGIYSVGIRITPADANQTVYVYHTGQYGDLSNGYSSYNTSTGARTVNAISGFTAGTKEAFNNYSCSDGAIGVGAYNNRDIYVTLDGSGWYANSDKNRTSICSFSSHGEKVNADGTTTPMPQIVAPGSMISSYSMPYVNSSYGPANGDSIMAMTAFTRDDFGAAPTGDDRHIWGWMPGTSMASPACAGTIALWLEADPNLTRDEILEIMAVSASNDDATTTASTAAGYGKLNAVTGLQEVIRRNQLTTIGAITDDTAEERMIVTQDGNRLTIFVGGETALHADIYSTSGALVKAASTSGDTVTIPTSSLAKGVYVVAVNTSAGRISRRVLIK